MGPFGLIDRIAINSAKVVRIGFFEAAWVFQQ